MNDDKTNLDEVPFSNPEPFLTHASRVGIQERHLPHWQLDGAFYFVTSRLVDSLPADKLQAWRTEKQCFLREHPRPWDAGTLALYREQFPQRIERWLDQGRGACVLRDGHNAREVLTAARRFDGERCDLASLVVMPNHMHALFQLRGETDADRLVGVWKGVSAREINRRLARRGNLWQQENWDRIVRGLPDLVRCFNYIKQNPAMAGLSDGEFLYYEAPGFLPEAFI
ncbi:MAG: transposase [Candidatus Hydrogenedentes bacterium]|nr:transposase [Candidatus Hydrogenedentota bacterium]